MSLRPPPTRRPRGWQRLHRSPYTFARAPLPQREERRRSAEPPAPVLFFVLLCGFAITRAIQLRWVSDDAFISFRYARNLVRGHGLVFNVGERVEGYTNFLWTVLTAAGMKLGIEPILFTHVLGILGFAGTIAILTLASWKLFGARARSWIPFAAVACALHRDLQVWATSGLETSWVTLAVTMGGVLLVFARSNRATLAAGFLLVAAILLRPDGIVAYAAGVVFLLAAGPRRASAIFAYLIPFLFGFLPYWSLRALYYGHFYPNTYYAKSAGVAHYAQGFHYATLYAIVYPVFGALVLAGIASGIILLRRARHGLKGTANRLLLLASIVVVCFTAYVIRVGGDFMFARFLVPITPLAFLAGECILYRFVSSSRARIAIGLVAAMSVLFRTNIFSTDAFRYGITDERSHYPLENISRDRRRGERIREILTGTGARVAFYGGYASLAYYSDVDPAIEANAGLTDEHIAHQRIARQGRVGHEKMASSEYLAQRGVQIAFRGAPTSGKYRRFEQELSVYRPGMFWLQLGEFPATLLAYDSALMESLKRFRDVEFFDLPRHLDQYLAQIDRVPAEQVQKDYTFLREFYFVFSEDHEREAKILARLERPDP